MLQISQPTLQFVNPRFNTPVAGGKMYFGLPNTDPKVEENRVDVYYKDLLGNTVVLPQPVILSAAGVPLYLDRAIEIMADGAVSIRVDDRNGIETYLIDSYIGVDGDLREDVTKGTSLIRDVKHVASVAALGALSGSYDGQIIYLDSFYLGEAKGAGHCKFTSVDPSLPIGAAFPCPNGWWVRQLDGFVTPEMFGCTGLNDSDSFERWLQYCCHGNAGRAYGHYDLEAPVSVLLNSSTDIECAASATFTAKVGFPQNKMILVSTGSGSDHVFKWHGGQFFGEQIPNSLAGQANDIFYFAAENCSRCDIVLDKTKTGDSWIGAGSDSHLFIAGARNIRAYIGEAIGAVDAAIYISSNFDGDIGNTLEAGGNFHKCITSIITKRKFEQISIYANTYDCVNGVGTGLADIAGEAEAKGGDGFYVEVNAYRTERPAFFQGGEGGIAVVNVQELGVSIPGYTSTQAKACYLSGASNMTVTVNANKVNPSCTKNTNFVAVDCDDRSINGAVNSAINHRVSINANDIGRSFVESGGANGNLFLVSERSMTAGSVTVGAGSSQHRTRGSASEGFSIDEASVSLGGMRGAEAFRVVRATGQVNYLQITGALAGAAAGVVISSQGADANPSISIAPKNLGVVFIGGTGGNETMRVQKGQANGFDIQSGATGSGGVIAARGSDLHVHWRAAPKGSEGRFVFPLGNIPDAADDAAAAVAGVPVGGEYRTGSALKIRTS